MTGKPLESREDPQPTVVATSARAFVATTSRQPIGAPAQAPDGAPAPAIDGLLHVQLDLTAHFSNGRAILASERSPLFQVAVVPGRTTIEAVRDELQQLLEIALGKGEHQPPRLAWEPLIEQLDRAGLSVSEAELRSAPLTLVLSPGIARTLGER